MRQSADHGAGPSANVSVVVPCLNEEAHVGRLLEALARQDHQAFEVIVVDGGSTDGTLALLEAFGRDRPGFPLTILRAGRCPIPFALNLAVRAARTDVIVRLDAHSRPDPSYLRAALEALRLPKGGVAGGGWDIHPGRPGLVASAIALALSDTFGSGGARYRHYKSISSAVDVDTVPFGCFTKRLWQQLHGYDERLLANEDYEFNYRVRQEGLRVILDPRIHSGYFARSSLRGLARQYFRYGWWKAEMLKLYPRSLRLRQAVPGLFVASLLGSLLLAIGIPSSSIALFGLLAAYALTALAASARICARSREWSLLPVLPLAFATIHVSWGTALVCNLLSFGFGPHVPGRRGDETSKGEPSESPVASKDLSAPAPAAHEN